MSSKENRIFYYDNLKFFLITTVVVGHFIEPLTSQSDAFRALFFWIYSFHMPLFIFISGLFHKNENIVSKATGYLMIGVIVNIALFFAKLVAGEPVALTYFGSRGVPWFMYALAGYAVLSYILRKMDKRSILVFSIILGLFSGYDSTLGDLFIASRFIVYYPFFVLGTMVTSDQVQNLLQKKQIRIIGIFILIFWAVVCIFKLDSIYIIRPLLSGRNSFGAKLGTWGFLYRGLTYFIEVLACFGVMCIIPRGKMPIITQWGSRTLSIYFWHYLILIYLYFYIRLHTFLCVNTIGKLIWVLLAVFVVFVTGFKCFRFPTVQIMNACRYPEDS